MSPSPAAEERPAPGNTVVADDPSTREKSRNAPAPESSPNRARVGLGRVREPVPAPAREAVADIAETLLPLGWGIVPVVISEFPSKKVKLVVI